MNREYEILNRKLDVLFEELMWLRHDFQKEKYEKEIKELEYRVKTAQDELNYRKEDNRFHFEQIDEKRRYFRKIEQEFPKNEEPVEINAWSV